MASKVLIPVALAVIACSAHAGVVVDIDQPHQSEWTQVTLRDDGPPTVVASTQDGASNEIGEWRVTLVSPQTTTSFSSVNMFASIYNVFTWRPSSDGGIERIDVSFDLGSALSGFTSGLSGFVRPVVQQGGTIFSVASTSIAVDNGFNPAKTATWSLLNTSNWINTSLGNGLDLSASGSDIQFGFRWDLGLNCTGLSGCLGTKTVTTLDNLRFDITSTNAVPEPGVMSLFLMSLGLLGFIARRRQTAGS
jgi:hypothetical protein